MKRTPGKWAAPLLFAAAVLLAVTPLRAEEPASPEETEPAGAAAAPARLLPVRAGHPMAGRAFTPTSPGAFLRATAGSGPAPTPSPGSGSESDLLRKLPQEAFIRSIALPGWGQRYAGRPGRGTFFTVLEAGLWAGLVFHWDDWRSKRSEYETFASAHAGVRGDHEHQYYVDIGNFDNREEFNDFQRRQREFEDLYSGSGTEWQWDSGTNRERFKSTRIASDRSRNRMYYLIGGLALNRLLSAVDAGRGLAKRQRELRRSSSLSLEFDPRSGGPALVWRGNL